ncbi:MAG: AMP-binding protein [Planctomycetota bacterium]
MLLHSFLAVSAARWPRKTVLVAGETRADYASYQRDCHRMSHALLALGVERGDRVAVFLDNTYEAAVAILGSLGAGAAFMVLNPTTKPDKLAFVLEDSAARVLVTDGRKLAGLASLAARTPHLARILVLDPPPAAGEPWGGRVADWRELLAAAGPAPGPPAVALGPDDLAALIYTSGSTGNPKGVVMTHRNMVAAATSITTYLENRPDDVVLGTLPLSFDYGLYQLLMTLRFGGTLVLERSFAFPAAVLGKIETEKVTGFPIVPTMVAILLQMDLAAYDLSSLRYVTNTAAALPVSHIRRLRELLPGVRMFSMYGLTECKRVSYLPPDQIDIRPSSVGIAIPGTEVWVEGEDGRRAPPGVVGELVVRGPHVMQGYWRRPAETAAIVREAPAPEQRSLRTGDLFRTDEEGYLYFVGRKDDIIKSRGEKVSPREIENVLHDLDGVVEAAVIGEPDEVLGQSILAFVVVRPDSGLTARDVRRHCAARLEDYMVPQTVELRDALPRNSSGKIDKLVLRAERAKGR